MSSEAPSSSPSKIPRRCPSNQVLPPSRAVSLPPSAPSSPARRPSHAHTQLQDRRRVSTPPPVMRRTPNLSICIPHPRGPAAARTRPSPASTSASPATTPWTPHTRRASLPPAAPAPSGSGWARPPRTPYPKRPAMAERTPSASTVATYTSFDLQAPRTPHDERELDEAELRARGRRPWSYCCCCCCCWPRRLFARNRDADDDEAEIGETTALLGARDGATGGRTTARYVLAETWCYAKHMLPPILFFVVFVLAFALLAYRQAVGRIVRPPQP
ncbi:hypothetical protein JCM3770_007239 [Rhodotorula araucariae]